MRPPLSRSIGRPGEALPPNQGVPEALTRQYHNCHRIFFGRLQLPLLGQSCCLQHPYFHLSLCSSTASFTSCLQHCLQGHFPRALSGCPAIQPDTKKTSCSPFPALQTIPPPGLVADNGTTLLLPSVSKPHICRQQFSSQVLHCLPSLLSPDGGRGSPRTGKILIFPFHYHSRRICFPLRRLLEKQIVSVALKNSDKWKTRCA